MFVNLTFESDRRVHSMPPFRESTEDLASEASVTEGIPHLKRSTAVAANAIVSKGTGLKRWVLPSSNALARQSIPLLATGTVAGALDESFSNDSQLEIWAPDFMDKSEYDLGGISQNGPKAFVQTTSR